MSRPGFQIYHEDMESVEDMTDAQLGKLIRLLYRYSTGENITDADAPPAIRYAFRFMSHRIKASAEAYDKKVEQARKAAERRWNNANASERMQTHADAYNQTKPNQNKTNLTKPKQLRALDYAQRSDDMTDVMMDL